MSTPQEEHPELRYAEYVLGLLDAAARAEVEREVASSEAAAKAVEYWQRRLLPLAAEIEPREPPAEVWRRIRAALELDAPVREPPRVSQPGIRESLRFWQRLTLATSVLAAACIVALVFIVRRPAPALPYMASTLAQPDGRIGWTATLDIGKARLIMVPAAPPTLATGRAPELWLIPKGGKPIPVGMISANQPVTLILAPVLSNQVGPTAVLAVSVEPPGGSPTGQPTGPVVATGAIGPA